MNQKARKCYKKRENRGNSFEVAVYNVPRPL
jgi:hypothetical protein